MGSAARSGRRSAVERTRCDSWVDTAQPWAASLTTPASYTDQDPAEINLNVLTEKRDLLPKVGGASSKPTSRGGLFTSRTGDAEPTPRRGNLSVHQERRVRLPVIAEMSESWVAHKCYCTQMKNKVVSAKWANAFLTTEEAALAEKLQRYHVRELRAPRGSRCRPF